MSMPEFWRVNRGTGRHADSMAGVAVQRCTANGVAHIAFFGSGSRMTPNGDLRKGRLHLFAFDNNNITNIALIPSILASRIVLDTSSTP